MPFIIPMIFYHGQAKWEPRPLRSLFPQDSPLLAYVPQFDLSICNLHNVDEDQLRQDVFHNAMLLLLKAIIEKESLPHIAHTLQLIQSTCSGAAIVDVLELFFNYLAQIRPEITIDAIDEELAKLPEGGNMSQLFQERWAEYSYKQGALFGRQEGWKLGSQEGWQKGSQEGWQKGKQEGKQEGMIIGEAKGACNLLLDLLSSQFTVLPIPLVKTLRNIPDTAILRSLAIFVPKAESLEAFEALVGKTLGVPQS